MGRAYAYLVGDLPEGEALRLDTSPIIALFNVGGEFYVINDRCNHGNASISEDYLENNATVGYLLYVANPCLKTGKVLCPLATGPLTAYVVYVGGSDVLVDIPKDIR